MSKVLEAAPSTKYLATSNIMDDPRKLYTDLFIRTHALEKGMSIGNVRYGFGKAKAASLIKDLQHYLDIGGDHRFAVESCSVIEKYISYNEIGGADMSDIRCLLGDFLSNNAIMTNNEGGIYELYYTEIRNRALSSFDVFSQSRFSIRDFGTDIISQDLLKKALKLCERTPSACNRQSQRLHIYTERALVEKICKLQMGSNGFYEDMQGVILVCGDLNRYAFHELNQVYVDGGIYAMNLMYALHYYDIANIPLTMAHKTHHIDKIKREMNIPGNEQPVILVGFGSYKNRWKVAQSKRYSWKEYTCWNE